MVLGISGEIAIKYRYMSSDSNAKVQAGDNTVLQLAHVVEQCFLAEKVQIGTKYLNVSTW